MPRFISADVDDLCPEKEVFLILKKELCIADDYRFPDKQKNEIYNLLTCTEIMRQKRQLPYKRLLQVLSKTCVTNLLDSNDQLLFVVLDQFKSRKNDLLNRRLRKKKKSNQQHHQENSTM